MADEHNTHAPHVHITPLWVYLVVFVALLGLTGLTVLVSRVEMGIFNTPVAMLIATIKCVLVILFFMHLIHQTRLTWVVVVGSFLWLGVLFVLTFSDFLTRNWVIY